jgi:hypothetical protein
MGGFWSGSPFFATDKAKNRSLCLLSALEGALPDSFLIIFLIFPSKLVNSFQKRTSKAVNPVGLEIPLFYFW